MTDKINRNKSWNLKRHLILAICLILFYFILITPPVLANEPLTLKVGVYENSPKIFTDDKGNALGFWPDIIEYIALQEGWQIKWVLGTWPQCLERLENKEIDLMPDVSFTEPRSKRYAFSQETVLMSWTRIYARKGVNIQSILDLEGKKIAVMTGSVNFTGPEGIKELTRKFDIDCTFVEMNNYTEVFEALEKGEIDAGVTNKDFGNKYEKDFNIEKTSIIFRPSHIQFAFPKDSSLTPYLLEKIDYHMKELKKNKDSIYYQSLEKWLAVKVGERQVIPGWINWMLVGIGVVVLLLFGGNFILRSQVRSKTKELRQDIFERKQAEEELRASRDYLEKLTNSMWDAVFSVKMPERVIEWANDSFRLIGYEPSECIGKSPDFLYAGKDGFLDFGNKLKDAMAAGKDVLHADQLMKRKNGKTFPVEITVTFHRENDEVVSATSIVRDITERKQSEEKLKKTLDATIETISKIVEVKDPYTAGHQQRVSQLAAIIAKELNLSPDKVEGIRIASLIHDIGKISIPTEILSKSTTLSDIEFSLIKYHSQIGYDILKSIDFAFPIARIVLQHHEKLDGSGYPNNLKGDEILLEAKIIGVADVVEAMSSHRPYRPALGIDAALEEISKNRGSD
jgi:PAS domain S-box-containing protein